MELFGRDRNTGANMGNFILDEIRDLRRGMEGRDGELRGEIAAVRDAVATLSESVSRTNSNSEAVRQNVDELSRDFRVLRKDVDDIQRGHALSTVQTKSAWDGPKKIMAVVVALGGAALALIAIIKVLPIIGVGLIAVPVVP